MRDLPDKTLLRVEEVAEFFSVGVRTVYLWAEHQKLEEVRTPGNSIRITRKSVEDWVANCKKLKWPDE